MHNFMKLIEKSKKVIFDTIESEEKIKKTNHCDDVLPLEYFMQIPKRIKMHKFYQDVKIGDIVVGSVVNTFQSHVECVLICTMGVLIRDIDSLNIFAICRSNDLPVVCNFSPIQFFRRGDKIKGYSGIIAVNSAIVTKISRNENLEISMNNSSVNNKFKESDLGLISDDNLPSYFKIYRNSSERPKYFNDIFPTNELQSFTSIKNKMEYYNINNNGFSLLNDINRIQISSNETAKNMRNVILLKDSMKYVVKGVNYYKLKKHNEALQCYNRALLVYEENVDALVARGALRASLKSFELAIEDLERAVKINPQHRNAAMYLSQTIVVFSKSLPESDIAAAETLIKKSILSKDEYNKRGKIDIKDPNQFIVITDDDDDDDYSSDSMKKHKKSGYKKMKRHNKSLSKVSKKQNTEDSSSSDSSSSSSSSNNSDVKTMTSINESKKNKRKHSIDNKKSKHNKSRCRSSSSSSSIINKKSRKSVSNHSKHDSVEKSSRHISERKSFIPKSRHSLSLMKYCAPTSQKRNSREMSNYDISIGLKKHDLDRYSTSIHQQDEVKPQIAIIRDVSEENLKLKRANDNIKQIEDFISSLKKPSAPL